MLPIQRKISAYNHHSGNVIKYIVIHDVGTRSTAKNNVDYFSGGNRNASAHYFVDDTSVWQSVEDWNGAWHVGDGNGVYGIHNSNSIGIEMCLPSGVVTTLTEQNTIELTKYLMNKYNIPISRVVRHYDASRKNCPTQFNLDGKWTRWNNFKNKLAETSTPNQNNSANENINKPNNEEEQEMFLFYKIKGSDAIYFFNGMTMTITSLNHGDEKNALNDVYKACNGGRDIPYREYDSKKDPWYARLQAVCTRTWQQNDVVKGSIKHK